MSDIQSKLNCHIQKHGNTNINKKKINRNMPRMTNIIYLIILVAIK